jgi:polyisoprenyl-phosphate glycosyltransferase
MNHSIGYRVTLSIVLPVYNEELNIPYLLERLSALRSQLQPISSEVIFVDDHSRDRSPTLLKEACAQCSAYRYLRLSANRGSQVAILAGLEHMQGECAVFLASDLQDPPELIPQMLDLWRKGNQVIWAVRESREGISWLELLLANTFYWLLNKMAQVQVAPQGSDFALLDRRVVAALLQSVGATISIDRDIARLGFAQAQLLYVKQQRHQGTTKWSFERKLEAFADAFVSSSYMPLRGMSYLGMLSSLLGFLYALIVVALRLSAGVAVEGWASLMVVILILGGIQMTMLGILGEYLWRTLEESRRRPRYFLEEWSGLETSTSPQQQSPARLSGYDRG